MSRCLIFFRDCAHSQVFSPKLTGTVRGGLAAMPGIFNGCSRQGIKWTAETSEELTAVYRFEYKINT